MLLWLVGGRVSWAAFTQSHILVNRFLSEHRTALESFFVLVLCCCQDSMITICHRNRINFVWNEFWCECRWCCDYYPKNVVQYLRVIVAPSRATYSTLQCSQLFQSLRRTVLRQAATVKFPNRNMFSSQQRQAYSWPLPLVRWQMHVICDVEIFCR